MNKITFFKISSLEFQSHIGLKTGYVLAQKIFLDNFEPKKVTDWSYTIYNGRLIFFEPVRHFFFSG